MKYNEENIRLILGLKIRQLRIDRGFSLKEVSDKTGISVSYLNEIEKGKKNPKPTKLADIADALGVTYDWLVSLQLNKRLSPFTDLLKSNVLQDLPFKLFGLDGSRLMELFASDPARVGAFVNTIKEMARSYSISIEQFYFNALRAYQEMHDNYFPEIEKIAESFLDENKSQLSPNPSADELRAILEKKFSYSVRLELFKDVDGAEDIRSIYIDKKNNQLIVNRLLNENQKAFVYARELGFKLLNISERPKTFSQVKINSFNEVLNNFRASYFAGALLVQREPFIKKVENLFSSKQWKPWSFEEMINQFHSSPEMLLYRLTSLGPKFLGFDKLFFIRINHQINTSSYYITKELHLSGQHNPHSNLTEEHYCRRWISIKVIKHLADQISTRKVSEDVFVDAQVSDYYDSGNKYLVLSIARPTYPTKNEISSVSVGILLDDKKSQKIGFLSDPKIKTLNTGYTCERCPAENCNERVSEPILHQKTLSQQKKQDALLRLIENYSE